MNELVINFTPNGMLPTKKMTPHVPISPEEIVRDVLEACELGITMVHLHAREIDTGSPTYKKNLYAEIIQGIRKYAPDLIVGVSLSGRDFSEFDKRSEPLDLTGELKPDTGSLTLSSLNFNKQASINTPQMITDLAKKMLKNKIKPELEAFDAGMINYAKYLMTKRILVPPFYCNLLLGNIACAQADLLHAGMMVRDLPEETVWSIGGIGNSQLPMNSMAISVGGGVRVGLEDNIWFDKERTQLAKNIDLIRRIHRLAEANERLIMPPSKLRKILDLEEGHGKYGSR
ncbi:MAG: 3-keto-5-aminohexanoate cleavage protein [Methylococcaceae bacterium]